MIDLNHAPHPFPPQIRYDLDAIVARLRASAQSWVPGHFPNGRRVGDEWRLANIRGAAPRKQGSCVIALQGERAGDWHDFDNGQGGGPLSALEESVRLTGRDLFAYAARIVGWSEKAPTRSEPTPAVKPERDVTREIAFILEHAVALADTPAASYLTGRGLAVPDTADLLFHSDLVHWETKTGFPALIGVVRDREGEPRAVHRTYLQADGPDAMVKAAVSKPRMMLGKVAGGAVRLAPISDKAALGLSEGIETGLAVMTSCLGLPVWATLSTSGLEQVQLPVQARRVVILADHDASGAGLRAAEATARRLKAEGRDVAIALPPGAGDDFNDVLLREGPEAVAAIIQAALTAGGKEAAQPDETNGRHLPIGFVEPVASLPTLRADDGDLARAVNRAWGLLLGSNRSPWLFRCGGLPSWIVPDDTRQPMAAMLGDERLRHMLAKLAHWRRMNRQGELVPAHPPTSLVKSILVTPDPDLPVLNGIVMTPVFGRGGTLLTEPGYHPDARLFYCPAPGFAVPPIPEHPTPEQIGEARALLLDDLLGDFPFTSPSERAHAVALLLLGFLRAMIDGPTPLHLIEKPAPGTGATLLVDAVATILTGAGASVMTEASDDEEWRKRVTAKLRQIPSLVLIDNLNRRLDSSALSAALTAPYWEDRILGLSETTRLPIRCVWIATGNNPEFSNEMARRLVRIRLDARVDQPQRRDGFRHPDLMVWVRANRARLVAACLTLCRAWVAAGRPRGTRSIGSYESWAQILGGVLEVAGIEGFLGNLDEMMEASDGEGAVWRSFVAAWWDRFGTTEVGTGDLFELALGCEPPLPLGSGNDKSQRTRLGKALVRMRDRVFKIESRSLRLQALGISHKLQRWSLAFDEKSGAFEHHSVGSAGYVEPIRGTSSDNVPLEKDQQDQGTGVPGVRGVPFSVTNTRAGTRAGARAYALEHEQKGTPRTPSTPNPCEDAVSDGVHGRVRQNQRTPTPDIPDWLKEVQ